MVVVRALMFLVITGATLPILSRPVYGRHRRRPTRRLERQPVPGSVVTDTSLVDEAVMYSDFVDVIVGWPHGIDRGWEACMELGNPIPVAWFWTLGYPEPEPPEPITEQRLVWRWR